MISDPKFLLAASLKFLGYRPRSKKEIEDFLRKKTSNSTLINQTLDKLTQLKLVNDEAFAKWVIESRSRSRPRGARLLAQELKQKGIDVKVNINEVDLAQKALASKKTLKSRDQAVRFLQYRGFSWDAIAQALKKAYNTNNVK